MFWGPSRASRYRKSFFLAFFRIVIRLCVLFYQSIHICGLCLIDIFTLSDHERIPFISSLIFSEQKEQIFHQTVGGIIMYELQYLLCFGFALDFFNVDDLLIRFIDKQHCYRDDIINYTANKTLSPCLRSSHMIFAEDGIINSPLSSSLFFFSSLIDSSSLQNMFHAYTCILF